MVTLKEYFRELDREETGEIDLEIPSDIEKAMFYADIIRRYYGDNSGRINLDVNQRLRAEAVLESFENPFARDFLLDALNGEYF